MPVQLARVRDAAFAFALYKFLAHASFFDAKFRPYVDRILNFENGNAWPLCNASWSANSP
jgi:hypothetical protein